MIDGAWCISGTIPPGNVKIIINRKLKLCEYKKHRKIKGNKTSHFVEAFSIDFDGTILSIQRRTVTENDVLEILNQKKYYDQ